MYFLLYVAACIAVAVYAQKKGKSFPIWFFISVIITPVLSTVLLCFFSKSAPEISGENVQGKLKHDFWHVDIRLSKKIWALIIIGGLVAVFLNAKEKADTEFSANPDAVIAKIHEKIDQGDYKGAYEYSQRYYFSGIDNAKYLEARDIAKQLYEEQKARDDVDDLDLLQVCKQAVLKSAKFPDEADFGEKTVKGISPKIIEGSVKLKNALGVIGAHKYNCTFVNKRLVDFHLQ